jgi:acetoin utilization deacetylase AcuC-like enzyme
MKAFHSVAIPIELPVGHRFPASKYLRLLERVEHSDLGANLDLRTAPAVSDAEILRVHDADYWARLRSGKLDVREEREMGLPWSAGLVERARRSAGGTLAAARAALNEGIAVNLAGGTHHAFPDRAAGYCLLNDVAIAIRTLQAERLARRFLVVDCDVHQGDGTAAIFEHEKAVFTLSLHGRKNYPVRKRTSDLDVHLEDGTGDDAYLAALDIALWEAEQHCQPDLAFYLAGADPFADDRLGRLALSKKGLAHRDQMVLNRLRERRCPIAVVMAGGYAEKVDDIVDIHTETVRRAAHAAGATT